MMVKGRCNISEFHEVEVKFKDKDVLIQSLKEMGYNPKVHEKAQNLYGYQGDKRKQKAHIIIPRSQVGASSNDVGFEKVKKGFVLHASEFDSAWRTGKKLKTLKRTYAETTLKKGVSLSSKYSISSRKVRDDGKIEIQLRVLR